MIAVRFLTPTPGKMDAATGSVEENWPANRYSCPFTCGGLGVWGVAPGGGGGGGIQAKRIPSFQNQEYFLK